MFVFTIALLGLCFGSFVNALVWRLRQQETQPKKSKKHPDKYSITKGRSMCVHCGHLLSTKDLIPVISWIALRGKCRYCKKSISWQYPAVELATTLLFITSYIFWPVEITLFEYVSFVSWLVLIVGFMALVVYDFRWMLLPNRIVFPLYIFGAVFWIARVAQSDDILAALANGALAVFIGGGIFYLLFQLSKGKWIGGGDVKLGFLLGVLCERPEKALLMLFIASVLGSLASLPLMINKKSRRAKLKIPFGPFLIAGTIVVVIFGQALIDWYTRSVFGTSI